MSGGDRGSAPSVCSPPARPPGDRQEPEVTGGPAATAPDSEQRRVGGMRLQRLCASAFGRDFYDYTCV